MSQDKEVGNQMEALNYQFILRRPSLVFEEQIEEAILAIGSVSSATSFHETVSNALHLSLSNVEHSLVFLLHLDSNELTCYKSKTELYPLPKSGVLWEAVRRRSANIIKSPNSIEENDPLHTLFPGFQSLKEGQVILINPIVEKKNHRVIALMMAICDDPLVMQVEKIRWLDKNVLVAASRVLKHMTADWQQSRAENMLHLCSDLIDLDITNLAIKILKNAKGMLNVKMCMLFLTDVNTQELLCPAQNDIPLEKEVRLEVTSESIYGRCFLSGESLILDNVSQDARFNPTRDIINEYEPSTMMCFPIKAQNEGTQQIVGVAVACDKVNGRIFNSRDQENMEFVIRFSSSLISNTLAYQREMTLKKHNQALLQVARNLFSRLSDLNILLTEIMNEARSLTNAELCSLFLLDQTQQELVAAVFDCDLPPEQDTIRIKVGQGIAGLVAETGKFVNIKDAYKHPHFFKDVDKNTGFHTRNMLCFPIKDHNDLVVGVAELCNKINGNFFTKYDEELAMTFSVYCGISLYQSRLYKSMQESRGRYNLATEMMIYHMQVFSEDVDKLASTPIVPCKSFDENFTSFPYSPRSLPDADTVLALTSMMSEMNLIKPWRIQRNTLARFLLMVKKGYRDTPYHNWQHAVSVTHFSYLLYYHCNQLSFLSSLEVLAVFISCLCHDIDHRGTNNAFQVSSNSTLASLYSSEGSVMERHHFAQTVCILNTEDCNIFENMSESSYREVLDLIQNNILSTDIAHHLRIMKDIEKMITVGYQSSNPLHHEHMCSLLMTSCDLSSCCKSWDWAKKVSDLIYAEFFRQGDLEKALGHTPIEMMDRDKAFIPEQQLGFIDSIAGPAYRVLAKLCPNASQTYDNLMENRAKWEELAREGKGTSN